MKCPVCKTEIHRDSISCHVCGFDELRRIFLNVSDARDWEQRVLLPYRTKWQIQQNMEPWLKKEYDCRAFHKQLDEEAKTKVFLKNRQDLRVANPEQIQILVITDRFEEEIDDELVADISKFCNLRELSIQSFYGHRVNAEKINGILSVCTKIVTLAIRSKIDWKTLALIDLSKIEDLSVSLQGDVEPVCITADHLKSLDLSIYFETDLRRKLQRKPFDFSGMPLLEELRIWNGMGMDYASLAALKKLKKLKVAEDKKLKDLLWICSDYQLERLQVGGKITSLRGLEKQKNLRYLDLGHNSILDISVLEGLTELEHLDLRFNKIENTDALSGLKKLKYLNLWENPILDEITLRKLAVATTILNKFDCQVQEIERMLAGQVYGSFSGDVYRFVRSQDNADVSNAAPYRKRHLIEWRTKSEREKLMYAIQCVFEHKYREMSDENSFSFRHYDHRHRRIYIEKAMQIYPFLRLTTDMQLDMRIQ